MRAGMTGGVSVRAEAAGWAGSGGAALLPFAGPEVPPGALVLASSPVIFARTCGVRMPRSSWTSASRKRYASQRMM